MKFKFLFLLIVVIFSGFLILLIFPLAAVYQFKVDNNYDDIDNLAFQESKKIFPKICENRTWEINLSKNLIYFFQNCQLKTIIPIAYQSPPDKWYQTPTGYFRLGVKREKHISSLFPVRMDYAVQLYEDYFIHEIPYYLNGQIVSSTFSGGCIRLGSEEAKKFFSLSKTGDLIVSYLDLDGLKIKKDFVFPVNKKEFYIRQRFNNPLRTSWFFSGNLDNLRYDYLQHAGLDLAPSILAKDLNVRNIYDGKVVKIVFNGRGDHGLGNTVIVKHLINEKEIYSLYGHLHSINPILKEGDFIKAGQIIGQVGATGYGCNYWRIGKDGCRSEEKLDVHLHWEIKTKPVLESPEEARCFVNNKENSCYGYTPENPSNYGYFNPLEIVTEK
ncbi:MAG: hypothetical protein KatS3mg095_0423 [Candidatus Parcubacteria bacterium]|nr:MAG: hypothetical protein KatS3mg095_0423 [Candidatus Parcubacteria bacterium]